MASIDIFELTQHPERLNGETLYELRMLLPRYPYFQMLWMLYLKNLYLLHDASFGAELRKAVLRTADPSRLFRFVEGAETQPVPLTVPESEANDEEAVPGVEDRTLSLINSFLQRQPAAELLSSPQPDYAMDYASRFLADDAPQTLSPAASATDPLPDAEAPDCENPVPLPEADDDSYFTETLAGIYIRQHRYEKALEIIKRLNLKYPKKNAYFADQIRFLEKLIINNKSNK